MRFDVVTLFPEMFAPVLALGVLGRAVEAGAVTVRFGTPRDFGLGRHRSVDDTPYGGGAGMVMRVDCLVACMEALDAQAAAEPPAAGGAPAVVPAPVAAGGRARRVLLSPHGVALDQRIVHRLAEQPALMLVCGRYEGFDERVRAHVDEELSLGDFVLSGGELAAMAVIDACARLLPGVLGNCASLAEESHNPETGGLLEYPQYTRPRDFRGAAVPDVLLSGDHAAIAAWRRQQARERTASCRPDLSAADQGEGTHR